MPNRRARLRHAVRQFGRRHPHLAIAARRFGKAAVATGALAGAGFIAGRRGRALFGELRPARHTLEAAATRLRMPAELDRLAFRARRAVKWSKRLHTAAGIAGGLGAAAALQPVFETHADIIERRRWEKQRRRRGGTKAITVLVRRNGRLSKAKTQGIRFA